MEVTLEYWNHLAGQLILISALLSGFSIAIVANLLVHDDTSRLKNRILKAATVSAGSFLVTLFAMTKISMMTTAGGNLQDVTVHDFSVARIIGSLAFFIGLITLATLIGLSGWTKSRKTGIFTTIVGGLTLLLIFITLIDISF